MKKNLDEIYTGPWTEEHGERKYPVEPSSADIEKAVAEGTFETRGFQTTLRN